MPVMIDQEPLAAEALGFKTVGRVLSHVQNQGRLVVNLLIDGRVPDLSRLADVQQLSLEGRSIFIETASPSEMATEVLDEVEIGLADAELEKIRGRRVFAAGSDPQGDGQAANLFFVLAACPGFGGEDDRTARPVRR